MKKRKIIVTGSLAATLIFTSAKATLADTVVKKEATVYNSSSTSSPVQLDYAPGTGPTLSDIAGDLGINADDFREELRSGMTPKEILEDQGFSPSQIQKIFTTASTRTHSKDKTILDE